MAKNSHHYAYDAANLLETCICHLQDVIDLDKQGSHAVLYELKESLMQTENLIRHYFYQLVETESMQASGEALTIPEKGAQQEEMPSLSTSVAALRSILEQRKANEKGSFPSDRQRNKRTISKHRRRRHDMPDLSSNSQLSQGYSPSRNATDSLLFRLIVALQLCLVRIDDALFVVKGHRRDGENRIIGTTPQGRKVRSWLVSIGYCGGIIGVTSFLLRKNRAEGRTNDSQTFALVFAKVGAAAFLVKGMAVQWKALWMSSKLEKSEAEIAQWQQQWLLIQYENRVELKDMPMTTHTQPTSNDAMDSAKSKRLIEYALRENSHKTSSFWLSQGELRFIMVKKAMEVFYAVQPSNWHIHATLAAEASFHSLTGAQDSSNGTYDRNSAQFMPSYFSELIQNSWGLVSRPSIKNFSLQCSRLLKGASVADRIDIADVPCFVISRHPCPELAAAIQRYHRKDRRKLSLQLSTIDESEESRPSTLEGTVPRKLFAGTNDNFRQQDVIFHLTGGGFFAHMIAFDLLYLLDWSASTGAVVICPEFVLLPEHAFPQALQEITAVYSALVSGDAIAALGFEVNNIVVTGESTGGNLAAALCVKLCLDGDDSSSPPPSSSLDNNPPVTSLPASDSEDDYLFPQSSGSGTSEEQDEDTSSRRNLESRLPDALMLSCAVLNLSLELSHSRVLGTEDPVLPSGVISAISDAYLPPHLGISKKHMLASPFYAPDSILGHFPPTLLFASSNDPLLDDSVAFNERLRSNGVESELRAVQNMPHAYWGLGTAGFPEAKQVQKECCEWLGSRLAGKTKYYNL